MFLATALVVGLMVLIKDGRLLREAGLTGGCRTVATPKGQDGAWQACDPGKLQGAPDLNRQGCKPMGNVGPTVYWRCPAGIEAGLDS